MSLGFNGVNLICGVQDELMWAATWLYYATRKPMYMKYIQEESISASVAEFSWDLKYAGAQILLTKVINLPSLLLFLATSYKGKT